jgi:23S rRNA (pseudouridine1915-N3)-methyltransferase
VKIHLLAVGKRMPVWVTQGYEEYVRRMPPELSLQLTEITPARQSSKTTPAVLMRQEGERLLVAIPPGSRVIALDVRGRQWSTEDLAKEMESWMQNGRPVALLVGGPEGLDEACLQRAEQRWSLSPLTFPHPLVRILLAEQLYRAVSILHHHPYHRA